MKIHVGNLAEKTTESRLRASFEKYGKVNSLSLNAGDKDKKLRASAEVEMESGEHAQKAIASMNGRDLDGNRLTVSKSEPV